MADILNQIDESIARNEARFDPFGPAPLPEPVKSGIAEEAAEPEAVVEYDLRSARAVVELVRQEEDFGSGVAEESGLPPGVMTEAAFREAFAEIAADREAVEAVIAEAFATGGIVLAPAAPLVDEPVEPDPDDAERIEMVQAPEDVDENAWGDPAPRPWWRRYLPGGTR